MNYYYTTDGTEVLGPHSLDDILVEFRSGAFPNGTKVCAEGRQDWQPIQAFILPRPRAPQRSQQNIGPYAAATMQQDEKPLFRTSIHKAIYALYIAKGSCIPIALMIMLLVSREGEFPSRAIWFMSGFLFICMSISALAAAITYRTSELLITNRRVLIKVGLISRRTTEMFINKIESIAVDQGIFGRLCDFGTVTIRGTGGSSEPFAMIGHPLEFRNHVQQIQSRTNA